MVNTPSLKRKNKRGKGGTTEEKEKERVVCFPKSSVSFFFRDKNSVDVQSTGRSEAGLVAAAGAVVAAWREGEVREME